VRVFAAPEKLLGNEGFAEAAFVSAWWEASAANFRASLWQTPYWSLSLEAVKKERVNAYPM
jgi:hypothetical protein